MINWLIKKVIGSKNARMVKALRPVVARINQLEIEVDDLAISLLALQAPLAADLRLVTAAIKINNDLERMGDLAVSIAQRALDLIKEPVIRPMIDIPYIAGLVQSMVRKSLDAFVNLAILQRVGGPPDWIVQSHRRRK